MDDDLKPAGLTTGGPEHRLSGRLHSTARVGHAAGLRSSDHWERMSLAVCDHCMIWLLTGGALLCIWAW